MFQNFGYFCFRIDFNKPKRIGYFTVPFHLNWSSERDPEKESILYVTHAN